MDRESAGVLDVDALCAENANLVLDLDLELFSAPLNEGPVKVVAIVSSENSGLCLQDVVKEASEKASLVRLVEHSENADIILRFRRVLKVLYILAHNLAVCDQEAL